MKKKTKRKMIVFIIVLVFIFPFMVKVLDLNYEQMLLCVTFINLVASSVANFNLGEAPSYEAEYYRLINC